MTPEEKIVKLKELWKSYNGENPLRIQVKKGNSNYIFEMHSEEGVYVKQTLRRQKNNLIIISWVDFSCEKSIQQLRKYRFV